MAWSRWLSLAVLFVSSPAWASYRCSNANVRAEISDYQEGLGARGLEVVDEGSQVFVLSGVLGVRIQAEPGYRYEAFAVSPERSHLKIDVFDENQRAYAQHEVPGAFTIKTAFRPMGRGGTHFVSFGSLTGASTRCVYYVVARKPVA